MSGKFHSQLSIFFWQIHLIHICLVLLNSDRLLFLHWSFHKLCKHIFVIFWPLTYLHLLHTGILSCFLVQIIYLHHLTAPRGAWGVKRTGRTSGSTPRSVFALIFSQSWMNCINIFKFNKNRQNMPVFWCYFEF